MKRCNSFLCAVFRFATFRNDSGRRRARSQRSASPTRWTTFPHRANQPSQPDQNQRVQRNSRKVARPTDEKKPVLPAFLVSRFLAVSISVVLPFLNRRAQRAQPPRVAGRAGQGAYSRLSFGLVFSVLLWKPCDDDVDYGGGNTRYSTPQ